jgi:hypothetical protein
MALLAPTAVAIYWGAVGCGRWEDRQCAMADPAVRAGG